MQANMDWDDERGGANSGDSEAYATHIRLSMRHAYMLDAEAGVATDGQAAVRGRARLWAQARGAGRGARRW